jgi:ribosome-associated translation inhibitor RaiA
MLVRMDERQKLLDELARYLTLRNLTTDEQAREAIDETIREIEDRLRKWSRRRKAISGAGVIPT